jgi:CIC family chloride channel protein
LLASQSMGIGGVGYEGIEQALLGLIPPLLMLLLGIAKILATSFTIGSGGSGGVFAPSLYIGAMLGGTIGSLYYVILPRGILGDPLGYKLAGMAALFAGAAQAPLNVIIMIPEMSGSYSLIPPIMASAGASFIVSWLLLRGRSIYTIKLLKRGLAIRAFSSYILDLVKVSDVMTRNVVTIPSDAPFFVVETLFEEGAYGGYPVVDRKTGKLIGIITRSNLERARRHLSKETKRLLLAKDIGSRNLITITPDKTIREAYELMLKYNISRLPVVDPEDKSKLVGIITIRDVLRAYEIITSDVSA